MGVKASLTPLLERAAPKGDAQIRSAALTVANQAKDKVVSTLLKEIAQLYGYNLHLDLNGEGMSVSSSVCHNQTSSQMFVYNITR